MTPKRIRPHTRGGTHWYILVKPGGSWELEWVWFKSTGATLEKHYPCAAHILTIPEKR